MRQRSENPLGLMANPLVGMALDPHSNELSEDLIKIREEQREHEIRLLGTMLFQAFFLSLCILLYERWEWSQFSSLYEAMIFWFTASFALQAGFYFIYRAGFEDSNSHRKGLRKMRQSNKRRLAMIKYQQEKQQLETVLGQQLAMFEQSYSTAMSDGHIDAQENKMLGNQMAELIATAQRLQAPPTQPQPQQHQLQPKLNLSSVPNNSPIAGQASFQGGPPGQNLTLNLQPSGTQEEQDILNAKIMENL